MIHIGMYNHGSEGEQLCWSKCAPIRSKSSNRAAEGRKLIYKVDEQRILKMTSLGEAKIIYRWPSEPFPVARIHFNSCFKVKWLCRWLQVCIVKHGSREQRISYLRLQQPTLHWRDVPWSSAMNPLQAVASHTWTKQSAVSTHAHGRRQRNMNIKWYFRML